MSRERIIYVLKILLEQTDREHGLTLRQIAAHLGEVNSDKSCLGQLLRSDLELIETMCMERTIPYKMDKEAGMHNEYSYRLYRDGFGLNEARMVFDSVSTSQFLSGKQKRDLLAQMEGFLSKREIDRLKKRVRSRNCVAEDEELPGKLDALYSALENHRCLRYDYYKYGVDGAKHLHKQYHGIRPIEIIWGNEHYYLRAINPAHGEIRSYRIDRMDDIQTDSGKWLPVKQAQFSYGQFDMFAASKKKTVRLRVHADLMDMVHEKLGPDAIYRPDNIQEWAIVSAEVEISDGFYRWVLQQAEKIEILDPPEEREVIKRKLQEINEKYR